MLPFDVQAEQKRQEEFFRKKQEAIELVLGKQAESVLHAIVPFDVGGGVDLYYFPNAIDGTAFATMELIGPDHDGPIPNRNGTYELLAFTKQRIDVSTDRKEPRQLEPIELRVWRMLTTIGHFSSQAKLEPGETCEVPPGDDQDGACLVFAEYEHAGPDFVIEGKPHSFLVCIEIFRSEMEYAMRRGSRSLFARLKKQGHYPYSDLDRKPVI